MSNGTDTIYRPGVAVSSRSSSPPLGAPTDTSVAFMAGEATQGPLAPTEITSLDQFTVVYGARLASSYLYDSVEAFLREGGSSCYVSRLVDGAIAAKIAAPTLGAGATVTANSPGAFANGWQLVVAAATMTTFSGGDEEDDGGSAPPPASPEAPSPRLTFPKATGTPFTAQLLAGDGSVLQQSLQLYTTDDLAAWLGSQQYATLTGHTAGQALVALTLTLAGGADGTLPVADPDALAATLDAIPSELGPGQVLAPGKTDPEMQAAVLAHASTRNRVALLDAPQGADVPTLIAQAGAMRGAAEDRYGALVAPWATVPGIARGSTRVIPWSPIQAGLIARLDAQTGNANRAAAGEFGQSYFALGLTQTFSDADRQTLLYAGVNTARVRYGNVRGYGFRTLSDENGTNGQWVQLNWARLNMQIVAQSQEIGEHYVFSQIDGRGLTIAAFGGDLTGMLKVLYDDGALYGDAVEDAFVVNVSSSVNTLETISDGQLLAVLSVKMSPHAELVEIDIVKVELTEALA